MAELRDPNKLKKPKRPDLIAAQQPMTLTLQYLKREASGDYVNGAGSPGFGNFVDTSDDETDPSRPKFLAMTDIKREPFEDSEVCMSF